MSLSATFGVFVALGAVLALLVIVLRVLKRFAPHAGGGRGRLPMEVVQRLPIGPRQSIAVVRIGERVLAVAIGADGMQTLTEIEGDDRATVLDASVAPTPLASSPIALRGVTSALARHQEVRALPGAGWLLARLGGGTAAAASVATERQAAVPSSTAGAVASEPAAREAAALPGDAFRSVLGMALSSSTRLVGLLMVGGAMLLAAPAVGAQAPDAPNTAPEQAAASAVQDPAVQPVVQPVVQPAVQPAAVQPAPAGAATTPAARQAALRQAMLRRSAAARAGRGLPASGAAGPAATVQPPAGAPATTAAPARRGNTAAPAGGFATAAPSGTAPTNAVGTIDTLVARLAPTMDVRVGGKGEGLRLSGTVGVVVMMGLLTLLPTLVLMMTGFTRILVVLHFLKQAMGTQSAPPNHLIAALAMLLTAFVMAPTMTEVNRTALQPWMEGRIEQGEMLTRGARPMRDFMLRQTRDRDLQTFVEMSQPATPPRSVDEVPLVVVMSAFVTSELRTAFQLGFALFLPFIVIDIVVSSVLMSMGMMMLPPAMIALPFKLLLFVLVDGWTLVIQSLVQSFR